MPLQVREPGVWFEVEQLILVGLGHAPVKIDHYVVAINPPPP
jgi:hypothetical protein